MLSETSIEGIVTIVMGLCSALTVYLAKKHKEAVNEVHDHTSIIEKESLIMAKIMGKEQDRDRIMNRILILVLDICNEVAKENIKDEAVLKDLLGKSGALKKSFFDNTDDIIALDKEYQMIRDLRKDVKGINNTS